MPYVDNLLALQEAQTHGAEEALILNTRGDIAGASVANVFVPMGNRLLTPSIAEGALPGTMRARVLATAPHLGLTPTECAVSPEQVACGDALFLTHAIRGVTA